MQRNWSKAHATNGNAEKVCVGSAKVNFVTLQP